MSGLSLFFAPEITDGSHYDTLNGCLFVSIAPSTGASFTITNPHGSVSPAIDQVYTFPVLSTPLGGWAPHRITASGGSVIVTYSNGKA